MSNRPILDFITEAVNRELREPDGIEWVWFHVMDSTDHLRFDLWLNANKETEPLAYEAGTPESRFRRKCMSMVECERQRRAAKEAK